MGYTILGGIVVILFCCLPLIFNKSNKIKTVLHGLAQSVDCNIADISVEKHYAIGIDYKYQKLFFTRKTSDQFIPFIINLSEIQKCKIVKVNSHKEDMSIEKRQLVLTPIDLDKQEINLVFFDLDQESVTLNSQQVNAEKWQRIIEGVISQKNKIK